MAFEVKKYNLKSRVEDKRCFNIDHLDNYSLTMQLGKENFQVCITDATNNACLLLEEYEIIKHHPSSEIIECLKQLFDDHHVLLANFWKSIIFSIKNEKFSLVPADSFSKDHLQDYLKFNAQLNTADEEYKYAEIEEINAYSVFSIPKNIIDFLNASYKKVSYKLVHQSCPIIKSIFNGQDIKPYRQLFVNIDINNLNISVVGNGELMFYNQFKINAPADLIRYVMLVAGEFNIDISRHGIQVWSSVKEDKTYFSELKKYIKLVHYGHKPTFLKLSYEFDEIPDHQYIDVYGIYLCA